MTLAADTFIVTNKTVLSNNDLSILLNLYQPLVGNEAISLYRTKVKINFDYCLPHGRLFLLHRNLCFSIDQYWIVTTLLIIIVKI